MISVRNRQYVFLFWLITWVVNWFFQNNFCWGYLLDFHFSRGYPFNKKGLENITRFSSRKEVPENRNYNDAVVWYFQGFLSPNEMSNDFLFSAGCPYGNH